MNGYEKNEYLGRMKFRQLASNGKNKVEFTNTKSDKFNHIDAFFTALTTNYIYGVEIKNRSKKYDEQFDSLIVETIKFDAMAEHQTSNDTNECLMVYFFENVCYVLKWSTITKLINEDIVALGYKWLPDSTVNFHKMVYKPCYDIPKEYAYKYEFDSTIGKWKQIQKP